MEDELTPTLVNSYGSAKHTVINANGQSVVYWTPLQASGTVEGVTWGRQASDSAEGELPLGAFNPILGLQYQNTSVDTQAAVLNITVKLTVKVAFKGQRLSKFDFCPVCPVCPDCPDCPAPKDTILTRWGVPINNYTLSDGVDVTVNPNYALYVIYDLGGANLYKYLVNGTNGSQSIRVMKG